MKTKDRGISGTMLAMFGSVFLCMVTVLLIAVSFLLYQWHSMYAQFKQDHLQDALFRVSDEIRNRSLSPPLSEREQRELHEFTVREGVLVRWKGNDDEIYFDTLRHEPGEEIKLSVPSWNQATRVGELTVVWSNASEDSYPGYSIVKKVEQTLANGLLLGVLCALPLALLVTVKHMRPFGRIARAMEEVYARRKIIPVDEEETGDAFRIARGINYVVHQLDEQEKWRQVMMEDLAHELRTPLMLVSNQIEAIADGIFEPDHIRLEKILRDISRLTRLVGDIERIIQAQSARFELRLEAIDVVPVIKQAVASLEEACRAKNMSIELITPKIPCPILVDVDKMTQVFVNIVYNAIKYTHASGKIEIITDHDRDSGQIIVHVKDNGVGISQEELPRIFERFYRIDKTQSREAGGSGLGLTITKRLIESHDGKIGVTSKPGVGSVFTVMIPAASV
ncbi:sensor histidine kinase [Paenibacillus spongiae]|uniref:histidine kinase n=1 Tax=Paenibacillus spongiae TaxID=2909671 RepID=A0ABY5SCE6_9BACL|nr:HAMP domain-containing sensor histidine kinase [Paenibacillus spongiae]UVI31444.1 HAMP domain-containing histidine kinase [Paenibacillus spongiae]